MLHCNRIWTSTSSWELSAARRSTTSSGRTGGWRASIHPDINPGDRLGRRAVPADRRGVRNAERSGSAPRYDTSGPGGAVPEASSFGFDGFDFSVSVSGSSAPTFGDLFADVLRQRERRAGEAAPERGADLHQTITLSFEDAMRGGQRSITIARQDHCRACGGSGTARKWRSAAVCSARASACVRSARGHMVFSKPCPPCRGTGRQAERDARRAAVSRRRLRSESLTISVPAGLGDGARIRVPGKGHAGPQRRRARRSAHHGSRPAASAVPPRRRRSASRRARSPCTKRRSAPRSTCRRSTGRARLRVPPGTQSGQRFRLRERGVPSRARRPPRRSGRRSAAGAAARCSTSDRRSCCGSSDGSTTRTSGRNWSTPGTIPSCQRVERSDEP